MRRHRGEVKDLELARENQFEGKREQEAKAMTVGGHQANIPATEEGPDGQEARPVLRWRRSLTSKRVMHVMV